MAPPATLDREAVEAALPEHVRAALPVLFELSEVLPERWPDHPELADHLSLTAAKALRRRYVREGHSKTQALRLACGRLGLRFGTVRRRLARTRKAYLEAGDDLSPTDESESTTVEPSAPERRFRIRGEK